MRGSVILFRENNSVTILEDVEKAIYDDLQKQAGSSHCVVTLNDRKIDFGFVAGPVYWHDGIIYTD